MKSIMLTTIAAVVLVRCGESHQSVPPETLTSEPVTEVPTPPSPPAEVKLVERVAETAQSEPTTDKAPDISIWKAALTGKIEAVKQHLATGTDVNAKSERGGWTPLAFAGAKDHKEVAELLIAKGADVNAKNNVRKTPLHVAAMEGHKEIAELLIAKAKDGSKASSEA